MNRKKMIRATLVAGLFFFALGGWLLHLRIHPPAKGADYLIPFISGIVSVFCLPLLFWFRRTVALAYIINGFLVIIGTITMAQFSIVNFKGPVTAISIILTTTLADIAILWGKFGIGKALFDLESLNPHTNCDVASIKTTIGVGVKSDTDTAAKGRFFRYPHMGWWWVHLFSLALVYTLGNVIWK